MPLFELTLVLLATGVSALAVASSTAGSPLTVDVDDERPNGFASGARCVSFSSDDQFVSLQVIAISVCV